MNILYLCWPIPESYHSNGTSQRNHRIYCALAQVGNVDTLYLSRDKTGDDVLEYGRKHYGVVADCDWATGVSGAGNAIMRLIMGRAWEYRLVRAAMRTACKRLMELKKYDCVVARFVFCASIAADIGAVPLVVDVDDLESYLYFSHALSPEKSVLRRLWLLKDGFFLRLAERRVIRKCAYALYGSENDRRIFYEKRSSVLPNIPVFPQPGKIGHPDKDSKIILVVGVMRYGPNRDGLNHFLNKIWPRILMRNAEARLLVAGHCFEGDKNRWAKIRNVTVMGYVDNLEPLYHQSAFAIAPVYYGAGTNVKVIEALAHCRACVVTRKSRRGYETELDGKGIVFAENDEQFAKACIRLLDGFEWRILCGIQGEAAVRSVFSLERFDNTIRDAVLQATGPASCQV